MAVQISGNDITVPRDGTFSRNVSIAGTLTYEDVTNVDSIGLVTARNGIEVGASPGVAASISVDGNAIFSGITTIGGNVKVGTGVTLSPDGDGFFTGVTTATTFVGALTGNVTGNATGLTGTPNISAGTIAGSTGTFSGDVNVGAGITLDASAGIVTAANEVSAGRISILTVNTGGRLITNGAYLTIQAATGTVIEDLDGNNQVKANDGGSVQLYHNGTEQCSTSANGLAFPSGKGIDFSAAGNAGGMSSELLDDYEEGTYTATIYGSSTGTGAPFGMNPINLRYTKVGRLVTVTGRVYINSSSNNPTGDAVMLLPFTSAPNGTGSDGQGYSYVTRYNVYSPNSDWNLVFEVEPNSSYGKLLWDKPGAAWASMSAENHTNQNAAYYGFDFSYTTAT